MLAGAAAVTIRRLLRKRPMPLGAIDMAAVLIPPLGYFAIALTGEINVGYRHILPVLPFFAVFAAAVLIPAVSKFSLRRYALALLCVSLSAVTLWISPDFLAFFNLLAGGPDNGWRVLVDSNLDWGQDLQNLKRWMDENAVNEVWLSYFGEARPEYYNIAYRGLESNPPRLMNPLARPFYPPNPAPGIYAISATTLQGVHFENHDLFAWFRDQEPVDKIGYSIFLFEVPAQGEAIDIALGNIQLDQIAPADFSRLGLGTNAVIPRWFDPAQALPFLVKPGSAVLLPPNTGFSGPLAAIFEEFYDRVYSGQTAGIYEPGYTQRPSLEVLLNQGSTPWQTEEAAVFTQEEGQIAFRGFSIPHKNLLPGDSLTVLTLSEQLAEPRPVKMFLHLDAPGGELAAQWDGLGLVWQSWLPGDLLIQQHILPLPESLAPGSYRLWAGYYHPDTLIRWLPEGGEGADRVPLEVLPFQ
jgi:hypothetical protein